MVPEVGMASWSPQGTCRGFTDSHEMRERLCAVRHTLPDLGSAGPAGFLRNDKWGSGECCAVRATCPQVAAACIGDTGILAAALAAAVSDRCSQHGTMLL